MKKALLLNQVYGYDHWYDLISLQPKDKHVVQ